MASQARDSSDSSGGGGRGIVYRLIERVSSQVPADCRLQATIWTLSAFNNTSLAALTLCDMADPGPGKRFARVHVHHRATLRLGLAAALDVICATDVYCSIYVFASRLLLMHEWTGTQGPQRAKAFLVEVMLKLACRDAAAWP